MHAAVTVTYLYITHMLHHYGTQRHHCQVLLLIDRDEFMLLSTVNENVMMVLYIL